MTEWVVTRYKFEEDWKAWVPEGTMIFGSDELLLKFLRENAHVGSRYRLEITTLLRPLRGEEK